jgi:hypothetical protein
MAIITVVEANSFLQFTTIFSLFTKQIAKKNSYLLQKD